MVWFDFLRCGFVWRYTLWSSMVWYATIGSVFYSSFRGLIIHGVVWFGILWWKLVGLVCYIVEFGAKWSVWWTMHCGVWCWSSRSCSNQVIRVDRLLHLVVPPLKSSADQYTHCKYLFISCCQNVTTLFVHLKLGTEILWPLHSNLTIENQF